MIPRIAGIPIQEDNFSYVVAQVLDVLVSKEKKKLMNLDDTLKEFEEAWSRQKAS